MNNYIKKIFNALKLAAGSP